MKLTEKQQAALREAQASKGDIFHLPEHRRHSPATLASLVKAGLLDRKPVGVIWSLTDAGKAALQALDAAQDKN